MNDSRIPAEKTTPLDRRSRGLRKQIIRTFAAARRGHIGSAFSVTEILRVLYDDVLHVDPQNPGLADRDRCILSKGHGCLALYVLLADKGFISEDDLWKFCRFDGILGGHPEYGKVPGVEASTGSLGHGLSIGVGMALSARHRRSDYHTYVVMGDGEINEGSVWEAAMSAAKHKLSNLTALIDYNKQQSYSTTREVLDLEPLADKWRAFGFDVTELDGHNLDNLRAALKKGASAPDKPRAMICHTVKGKGIGYVEGNLKWHHKSKVAQEDIDALMQALEE